MEREPVSGRVLTAAAVILLLSGGARADDFLLLRDGAQKRGALSACDQSNCQIGAETVPRANIQWIGLDRDASTPPAARDPARDELHLVNQAVQSVTLTGLDSDFVHTTLGGQTFQAASSLPRASVAWIYLGLPKQGGARDTPPPPPEKGKEKGTKETRAKGEERVKDQPDSSDASVLWRFPARLYIFVPARCANCQATLYVLDFKTQDDMILLAKSRTISISWGHLVGHWFTYDPPVPLFPATTDVDWFSFDGQFRTFVTSHFYSHDRNRQPGPPPPGPAQSYEGPRHLAADSRALGEILAVPGVVSPDEISDWWQDRLADDWAERNKAQGGGRAGGAAGGCEAKQHSTLTGEATYTHHLLMENWPLRAEILSSQPGPRRTSYEKLRRISVYDVNFDLRFAFRGYGGRGRDRGTNCYTTDSVRHDSSGPRKPMPEENFGIPAPRPPHQEEADGGTPLDWLLGRQAQSVREGMESLQKPVDAAREAMAGVRDDLARGRQNFADQVRNVMGGAGLFGGAPGGPQGGSGASGPPHAVTLHARWFRKSGQVTEYLGDIIPHAVEGQEGRYADIVVSATRPPGSFDMPAPPGWTAANPKPPPPPVKLERGRWFRP
ncbi:MAG: hypothetical protein WD871_03310 [Xanthobacteraceae bacterium]